MKYFNPSSAMGEKMRLDMDAMLWQSAPKVASGRSTLSSQACFGRPRATLLDYGAYADLVLTLPKGHALPDEARIDAQKHLCNRLTESNFPSDPVGNMTPEILNFGPSDFTPDQLERLKRWWDIEDANPMGLCPVGDHSYRLACERLAVAFRMLREAAPDLFGETLHIVHQIVLASTDGTQRFDYAAGSSFALWGGIVINVEMHPGWPRYCKTIVHESGHNLLFAIARDEPLVLNEPGEVYGSPVRDDPRPMDGIFHAAFVAARESFAFDKLLSLHDQTSQFKPDDLQAANDIFEASVITFWQCHDALGKEGVLSELGTKILSDCEAFMSANFSLVMS